MVQIIFACEGWKSMIRFYILFSLPDKISKLFRVFIATLDFLLALNPFLPVIRANPCRWKCKNKCFNKICKKSVLATGGAPILRKVWFFSYELKYWLHRSLNLLFLAKPIDGCILHFRLRGFVKIMHGISQRSFRSFKPLTILLICCQLMLSSFQQ